jgi:hypothetical protein
VYVPSSVGVAAPLASTLEELVLQEMLSPLQGALQSVGVAQGDHFPRSYFRRCPDCQSEGILFVDVVRVGDAIVRHQKRSRVQPPNVHSLLANLERVDLQDPTNAVDFLFGVLFQPPVLDDSVDDGDLIGPPQVWNVPPDLVVRLHLHQPFVGLGVSLFEQETPQRYYRVEMGAHLFQFVVLQHLCRPRGLEHSTLDIAVAVLLPQPSTFVGAQRPAASLAPVNKSRYFRYRLSGGRFT